MNKGVIIGILSCAILLTGCVGGLQTNKVPVTIGFKPVIGHDTRVEESIPFPQDRSFVLWAQETPSGQLYMEEETISYNGGWFASKAWTDEPLDFYAYWPTDLDFTFSSSDGLQLRGFDSTAGDVDILVAKANADNSAGSAVPLDFEHILSRVQFRMIHSLSEYMTVKVTRIELSGVSQKADYSVKVQDEWSNHAQFGSYVVFDDPEGQIITAAAAEYIGKEFYAIPQMFSAKLEIEYLLKYDNSGWVPQTDVIDPLEIVWDPGKHLTYTLNLRMDELVCTAGISSWENR